VLKPKERKVRWSREFHASNISVQHKYVQTDALDIRGEYKNPVEVQLEPASAEKRPARYLFVATVKATDMDSGKQIHGLTTDLSEGGCCVLARNAPFSQGTRILLEITKNGVSFLMNASVVYNLKDQFMGLRFEEMSPEQEALIAGWLKAAVQSTRNPNPVGMDTGA
jgi:hypothetical protein